MTGARFIHDTLEEHGWEVLVANARKVKGLAPLACKTDKIDARVLAELSWRDLVPAIWLPDPSIRRERQLARYRLHLVRHRTTLKNRIHATLMTFGHPCPVSDLFGHVGRELLDRLTLPDPRSATSSASPRRPSCVAKPDSASASTNPAPATAVARSPSKARATCAGRCLRPRCTPAPPRLRRALPSDEEAIRPSTRPQSRPDRPLIQAHRGDLTDAHPQQALRPGRRPFRLAA